MDKIFIHSDVENLKFFTDKNGIALATGTALDRAIAYAMQGANIVGVFYTDIQAQQFYNAKRYEENLLVIGYFDEPRWGKAHIRSLT
jgi:hypothetical protein